MVARQAHNLEVSGSIPLSATAVSRSTNLRMSDPTLRNYYNMYLAKIAQLVEHDLAKVGVAGSSPVFRSNRMKRPEKPAAMVELVDTRDLKSLGQ